MKGYGVTKTCFQEMPNAPTTDHRRPRTLCCSLFFVTPVFPLGDVCLPLSQFYTAYRNKMGYAVTQLAEALRYKLEGRGFDSRCCHWNFSLT